ncbi:hypothetical protein DL96DRAFT_1678528 [Flagelloscypha sp. PMI_526]|nr:hypothetical protein DL96DRAFT_1678528 [Flagelloscypha sp. PMI_526]
MSGLEILGAIGSAVSIIDGIVATKSYLSDFRHSTKEREQIKSELQHINILLVTLQDVISLMPHDKSRESVSQAFIEFKSSFEKAQSVVQESSTRVLWTADKAKIKEMQNRYERLGTILNVSLTGYNTQMSMNQHTSTIEKFNQINKNLDTVKVFVEIGHLHAIQNWLTSNYLLEDELSDLRKVRKPHSGKWLLESETFQNWLAGTEKVLVLKGPPGCGKTILSSIVADHLENLDSHCFPILIQHSSNMTQKIILCRILSCALGRAALSQSAAGLSVEVPSRLLTLYQRRKLEESDIQQITSTFLRSMSGPLYFVLDALDELSTTPRNDLIPLLVELSPQVRLFITTRPLAVDYPHVSYSLSSSDLYDLKSFVYSEVDALDYAVYGEPDDVSSLKELIMAKSSEIFLLASLHIRELKSCLDMDDALEIAATLPTTDRTRYSRSIDRIRARDTRRATTAIHCLVWVWQAKRKLTLEELQTAVACSTRDLTKRSVNRALVPRHQLLDLCDGLLVMNDHDGYIVFVHLTARQYFEEHADQAILEIPPTLGASCLGYLNALHSNETLLQWSEEAIQCSLDGNGEGRGFFDYASRFWGEHPLENSIDSRISALLENNPLFAAAASLRAAQMILMGLHHFIMRCLRTNVK